MQRRPRPILIYAIVAAALPVALLTLTSHAQATPRVREVVHAVPATRSITASLDTATFAGGCFWSMERPFDHVPGVVTTAVGYAGGHTKNPTYEEVSTRKTGHAESVQVVYDPAQVTYDKLLDVYWHNIDPVTKEAQFCDGGNDYRTIVFYRNDAQRQAAEHSRQVVQHHFKQPLATEIIPASTFWMAEEYHQHFADRNPVRYNAYRIGCRRGERLTELWGASAAPFVPTH